MADGPPTNAFTPIQPGKLHTYAPRMVAFEHEFEPSIPKPNALIFVGGLFDGMLTVPFVPTLAGAVSRLGYTLFSVILSSSYSGWGIGSLGKDVEQLGMCVDYVKKYKSETFGRGTGKVVIMGHSTGSQDVLHYLIAPNPLHTPQGWGPKLTGATRPPVDGAILQAPASDREGMNVSSDFIAKYKAMSKSPDLNKPGNEELVPLSESKSFYGHNPVSIRRFLSLASPDSPEKPSEDDLFSSDLSDAQLSRTFGVIGNTGLLTSKSLLAVMSGADEYVPQSIDKALLLQRWAKATKGDGVSLIGSIVPGARHAIGGDDQAQAREYLTNEVLKYLSDDMPKL